MFQFIDISKSILYDLEKTHNVVLEMINACVSHEMRNPLNSIIAQNIEKGSIYLEIEELVKKYKQEALSQKEQDFIQAHEILMQKLTKGFKIQQSSSNILTFIV